MRPDDYYPASASDQAEALMSALFIRSDVQGVHARTGRYETVVEALSAFLSAQRPEGAEVLRFPPVMSRAQLERQGYLKSFPHLLGVVSCLCGAERHIRGAAAKLEAGEDWTTGLKAADLVLSPAACYPVYPIVAARTPTRDGFIFDVASDCFRHEPSMDVDRLQSFRMREFVRIGSPDQVTAFQQAWVAKAGALADQLGLVWDLEIANDPFFGRGGQLMAASQMEQALKFELTAAIRPQGAPSACMSFNYHQDHFGVTWDIKTVEGEVAHTGCVAFGIDRLALALFVAHGADTARWPAGVREALRL